MTVKELIKFGELNKNVGACVTIRNTNIILYIGMDILDLKLSIGRNFLLVQDEFESDCMRLVWRDSGVAVSRIKLVSDYIQAIWFTDSIVLNNNLCSKFEDVLLYYNGRMNNLCNVIDGNKLYCRTIASNSKLLGLPVTNVNDNEQGSPIDTVSNNIDNCISNKPLSDIMDSYRKYEHSLNHLFELNTFCNQSCVYVRDLLNNGMLDFNVNTGMFSLRYQDVSQWLEGFRIQYGWVVASSESEAALWYLNADSVFKLLNGVVNPVYGCVAHNNDTLKKALSKKGYTVILQDDNSMTKVYTNYFNIERSSSIHIEDYYIDCGMGYPDFYRGILGDLSRSTTSKANRGSMSLFLTPDNMVPLYPLMVSSSNDYKVSNLFDEAVRFSYNSPVGFDDRNGAESARSQYLKDRRQFFNALEYYKGQNMHLGLLYRLKGSMLSGK